MIEGGLKQQRDHTVSFRHAKLEMLQNTPKKMDHLTSR